VSSVGFLILIVSFGFLWFVLVRPQRRRQSEQQRMISELHVGDEVLTAGGIYGSITQLDDNEVSVEIAPDITVRVARRAIAGVSPRPDEVGEADGAEDSEEADESEGSAEPEEPGEAPTGVDRESSVREPPNDQSPG